MTKATKAALILMGSGLALVMCVVEIPRSFDPLPSHWAWLLPAVTLLPGLVLLVAGAMLFGYSVARQRQEVMAEDAKPRDDQQG